jgi:hypothetical protein
MKYMYAEHTYGWGAEQVRWFFLSRVFVVFTDVLEFNRCFGDIAQLLRLVVRWAAGCSFIGYSPMYVNFSSPSFD